MMTSQRRPVLAARGDNARPARATITIGQSPDVELAGCSGARRHGAVPGTVRWHVERTVGVLGGNSATSPLGAGAMRRCRRASPRPAIGGAVATLPVLLLHGRAVPRF